MKNFRTYQLAKEFHHMIETIEWPSYLREQVLRASSSIVLNLAEGAGLPSKKLKSKHYFIALGSLREVQAAMDMNNIDATTKIVKASDSLAAHLYKLCQTFSD